MRVLLGLSLVFVLSTCGAQDREVLSADASIGLVLPTGKALSSSYVIGMQIGIEGIYRPKNYFIALELTGDLFVNNPPSASSISDNLILFGPSLKAGYSFTQGKITIEPFVSVGYEWGINSIAPRKGGSGQSIDLMTLKGLSIGPGMMVQISERASIGVCYKFYSPYATLTQDAMAAFNSGSSTQLYGPLVSIPDQRLTLDRVSIRFHWKL